MIHKDYVGTTLHAYNLRPDKGYNLICNLFEKVDKLLLSDKDEYKNLHKFKYSNPTDEEVFEYGRKLGMGVYGSILFQYYLDKI
ncbi:hypothetical protein [Lysinibacillus sp. NPDC086135]|uniref:hypothetical protein n=1 Tax=Lysinibacillus sp. NPDC086135 TaxID=3364130 RepID=UPI0037FB7111